MWFDVLAPQTNLLHSQSGCKQVCYCDHSDSDLQTSRWSPNPLGPDFTDQYDLTHPEAEQQFPFSLLNSELFSLLLVTLWPLNCRMKYKSKLSYFILTLSDALEQTLIFYRSQVLCFCLLMLLCFVRFYTLVLTSDTIFHIFIA